MKWILSLIITLLLSVFSYCEILPDGTKYNLYNDFSGGLNTRDPAHKLKVSESPYIRNCYIDDGEIQSVNGSIIIGSTNTLQKVNLFKRYVKSDGNIEYIVSDSSVVLMTQDFTNFTLLKGRLNSNYRLRAKQIEDKIYFTNGSDNVFTYNGTTVVVLDGGTYGAPTYKTPNVPKFKYIEYYQNRMWGFNLPDNPSALRWHLLLSTDTVPITYAPDHELAWSNSNLQLNIDKGNGTVGAFLRVYAGQLFVGKERGIHYIYGNEDANYAAVPIVKDYGFLSDESVVEQDNVLLGFGNDGIYEFNGQQMTRISDKIFPDVQNFNSNVTRDVNLTWDTQQEFNRGSFSGTTTTAAGFLTITYSTYVLVTTAPSSVPLKPQNNYYTPFLLGGSTSTGFVTITTNTIGSDKVLRISSRAFTSVPGLTASAGLSLMTTSPNAGTKPTANMKITIRNMRTGATAYAETSMNGLGDTFSNTDVTFQESAGIGRLFFTSNDILAGNFQLRVEQPDGCAAGSPNCELDLMFSSYAANIFLEDFNQGQYISDIATSTNNNGWSAFNSQLNLNNGSVNFYYRTSTSTVNISTYPWIPISPGAVIGSSQSSNYIQWAATITVNSTATPTNVDYVKIVYQTGGGADTLPIGIAWKNRYYLAVTTTTSGNTSLIYVKSRNSSPNPYGWTVLEGINTKSMLATPDVWYAGASTGGVFYRMDYGTNFNGAAINQIYETNENNFEQPFMNKNVFEFGLDCDMQTNSNFTLARSIDNDNFVEQTISNSGSGRMIRRLSYPFEKGNSFRWRFVNTQVDKPMTIYNWIVYFKENATRTNLP